MVSYFGVCVYFFELKETGLVNFANVIYGYMFIGLFFVLMLFARI